MHQSTPSRPHTAESQEPVRTPRRVPPKTIEFLNSVPDTEIPFPKERQNELEICDPSLLLHNQDSTFSSPAAGSRTRSPVRGISSLNVGGETASIVIRLPKRWKVGYYSNSKNSEFKLKSTQLKLLTILVGKKLDLQVFFVFLKKLFAHKCIALPSKAFVSQTKFGVFNISNLLIN